MLSNTVSYNTSHGSHSFYNIMQSITLSALFKHYVISHNQGSGIGGRGVYPRGRKNFENTPPEDLEKIYPPRPPPFFDQNLEINVNLTGFSLNLVKFRLI